MMTLTPELNAVSDTVTREQIDDALAGHEWITARVLLSRFFNAAPTLANAQFVLSRAGQVLSPVKRISCRMAVLRSFTVEPVLPLLRALCALQETDLDVKVGEFNTYAQEIINPGSWLYAYDPQVVVLAVQTRDLLPDLWVNVTELTKDQVEAEIAAAAATVKNLIRSFRQNSAAHLIVHNFELCATPRAGILDGQLAVSQADAITRLNEEIRRFAIDLPGIYLLDYDGLVARHGRARWHDERKWLTARLPIAADYLIYLAREYQRFLAPLTGRVCKALAIDLDNTLWGGVIGEDGMTGIKLGAEYPGAAFVALQQAILDLYRRGVILAACSKNNFADAMEALEHHPGMLLRPHHFAALRINWQDKARSLREIAQELNIGIDALAFIDDNPVERRRVRMEVPEVTVIDLPGDPMEYADALRSSVIFERLMISAEDQERGRYYAEQRQRTELQETAGSLEDFYRSLKQVVEVEPVSDQTLARVAQLTQKTNQFNTTTRRYTEQEIQARACDAAWRVYGARVTDRFGDNGLVGVAVLHLAGECAEIDTFLMSCRVIGRTVETAILADLMAEARRANATKIRGEFIPSKKNAPAQEFYAAHGFTLVEETPQGQIWEADLTNNSTARPAWVS